MITDVADGDDTRNSSVRVEYRQSTNLAVLHNPGGLSNCVIHPAEHRIRCPVRIPAAWPSEPTSKQPISNLFITFAAVTNVSSALRNRTTGTMTSVTFIKTTSNEKSFRDCFLTKHRYAQPDSGQSSTNIQKDINSRLQQICPSLGLYSPRGNNRSRGFVWSVVRKFLN
jgi:hypothetical protein